MTKHTFSKHPGHGDASKTAAANAKIRIFEESPAHERTESPKVEKAEKNG